jgi:hypothetical protein
MSAALTASGHVKKCSAAKKNLHRFLARIKVARRAVSMFPILSFERKLGNDTRHSTPRDWHYFNSSM